MARFIKGRNILSLMFAEENLKLFDDGDKKAEETRLLNRPKTGSNRTLINYPAPYSKFGGDFEISDITDYMSRMSQIASHMEEGMKPESCLVLIQDYKEQFLNYTILSYLGFCKSRKTELEKNHSEVPKELTDAIRMTKQLAFYTALETVKKLNPSIKSEEDFRNRIRHETADQISCKNIECISDIFSTYFTPQKPEEAKEKAITAALYCNALHLDTFSEFLKLLEKDLGVPETASKIPSYFSALFKRLYTSSS